MALMAKTLHQDLTLNDGTPVAVVLEAQLDVENLVNPEVWVWNTSAQAIQIDSLSFELDLGATAHTITLQSSVAVAAGARQKLTLFNDACMINRQTDPRLRHTMTLSYTDPGGTPSVDVRYLIIGQFDADPTGAILFRDVT